MALAVLATLAISPGLLHLRIRTDGQALVPTGSAAIATDRAIRDEFGLEDPVVVLIRTEHPEGVYNFETLDLVAELTTALSRLPGVNPATISSLATDRGHRVYPGTIEPRPFLDPRPETSADLQRIRNDVRTIGLYTGVIVSDDDRAAAILVGVPSGADRISFLRSLGEVIDDHGAAHHRIDVIGAPVAESLLGTHILEDLGVPAAVLGHATTMFADRGRSEVTGTAARVRNWIARHLGLAPLAMLMMALVFVVSFRSLLAALLPLMEVGVCLVFVFSLMGWCDVPIYLTIAVVPVILTAVGVADEIHIFHRYFGLLRADPGRPPVEALDATMREMWVPVVKTSLTTAIGFCSFALSPIAAVRAFGVFTAAGVLFCLLWSLTVIPALLVLIPPRRVGLRRTAPVGARGSSTARLGAAIIRGRPVVLILAIAILVLAPLGARRLFVQDSWIDGFAPSSGFREATAYFNQHFLGAHVLIACVDAGSFELRGQLPASAIGHHDVRIPADPTGDPTRLRDSVLWLSRDPNLEPSRRRSLASRAGLWLTWIEDVEADGNAWIIKFPRTQASPVWALGTEDADRIWYRVAPQRLVRPAALKRLAAFEHFLAAQQHLTVGGARGPATYLATTRFITGGLREERRRIPDTVPEVRDGWANYLRVRGAAWHRRIVNAGYSRGLISIYMKDANFVDTAELIKAIREHERIHLAPFGMRVELAGDVAVSQTLIQGIVSTQVRTVLVSLVGILLVAAILGGSLRWGVYCVLPVCGAVLVNFAAMGWLGIPLGVATSMFAGTTLGIGVDFAIHLMERYRFSCRQGVPGHQAVVDALVHTGPAVLVDGCGVALGFGVMMLSQVPANARLGGLIVLSVVTCVTGTLLLLPALLRAWPIPASGGRGAPGLHRARSRAHERFGRSRWGSKRD